VALLLAAAGSGRASFEVDFTNGNITNNTSANGSAFKVVVYSSADGGAYSSLAANQVVFAVSVSSSAPAGVDIDQVYFQDGTLLALASTNFNNTSISPNTVNFTEGANPGALPGGNGLSPIQFHTTRQFDSSATKPGDAANSTTILPGETEGLLFTLKPGLTYTDVVNALEAGIDNPSSAWNPDGSDKTGGVAGLRIGLHVQNALGSNSNSDSFVDTTYPPGGPDPNVSAVPAPSSVILLGIGGLCLVGFVGVRRRRPVPASA
jgi:hypothetical protein